MKAKILWLLLVSAVSCAVNADDIVANDGTVYKDVTVQEITPLGINFASGGNACWLDYRDMPVETAKKYGYDSAKAAAFEQSLARNQGNTATATTPVTAPAQVPAASAAAAATPVTTTADIAGTTVTAPSVSAAVATPIAGATVTTPSVSTTVTTPAVSTTVSTVPAGVTVATPVAAVNANANAIEVVTPIASVTLGQSTPAATPTQVVVINPDTPVVYDTSIVYEPVTTTWVLWNGRYYPRYWWHYWYWDHHWVYWNGRYYPGNVFYGGGRWHGGHYYPRGPHGGAPHGAPGYRPPKGRPHGGPDYRPPKEERRILHIDQNRHHGRDNRGPTTVPIKIYRPVTPDKGGSRVVVNPGRDNARVITPDKSGSRVVVTPGRDNGRVITPDKGGWEMVTPGRDNARVITPSTSDRGGSEPVSYGGRGGSDRRR
ncbi:MAG: hypothetical protein PHQ27_01315 [Victivallales bacterium]|nr:hypothetical protein [Victivallales bacterium]